MEYEPTDSEGAYTIASPIRHPDLWNFIRPGDPFDAAICFVQQVTNDHLLERVSPRLLWNENRVLGLHQVASSLIGAMWLQFARAVDARNLSNRLVGRLRVVNKATTTMAAAAALGTKLRASATPLREAGLLDITFDRSGTERTIQIARLSRRPD